MDLSEISYCPDVQAALLYAEAFAELREDRFAELREDRTVGTDHILVGILKQDPNCKGARLIRESGITVDVDKVSEALFGSRDLAPRISSVTFPTGDNYSQRLESALRTAGIDGTAFGTDDLVVALYLGVGVASQYLILNAKDELEAPTAV